MFFITGSNIIHLWNIDTGDEELDVFYHRRGLSNRLVTNLATPTQEASTCGVALLANCYGVARWLRVYPIARGSESSTEVRMSISSTVLREVTILQQG